MQPPWAVLAERERKRGTRQIGELGAYQKTGAAWRAALAPRLGGAAEHWPAEARGLRDDGRLNLAHRRLAVELGLGGNERR